MGSPINTMRCHVCILLTIGLVLPGFISTSPLNTSVCQNVCASSTWCDTFSPDNIIYCTSLEYSPAYKVYTLRKGEGLVTAGQKCEDGTQEVQTIGGQKICLKCMSNSNNRVVDETDLSTSKTQMVTKTNMVTNKPKLYIATSEKMKNVCNEFHKQCSEFTDRGGILSLLGQLMGEKDTSKNPGIVVATFLYQFITTSRCKLHEVDKNLDGMTLTHMAARLGFIGVVRCMLNHDTDVDEKRTEKVTLVMDAAMKNRITTFEMLLKAGADINLKSRRDGTVVDMVCKGGDKDMLDILHKFHPDAACQ